MNYGEANEYISHLRRFGSRLGLGRIERLLSLLDNPEKNFRSIVVGGTSGKGSTCSMIGSVLREAGYSVGVFTKPTISVNGEVIPNREFARLTERIKPLAGKVERDFESPTFFEFLTALAFEYFRERRIDFAVLEVGLGGRLDSTNTVTPEVSVVTNVSLEHVHVLGKTVEKIAWEKGGIIKENGTAVTGSDDPRVMKVLRDICKERKAGLFRKFELKNAESFPKHNSFEFRGSKISVPLGGKFQISNIGCALRAVDLLKAEIPLRAIRDGLKKVKWYGRFEVMEEGPTIILDSAKDPLAVKKVFESLDMFAYEKLYTVFGPSKDKLIGGMVREASGKTDLFILTRHSTAGRAAEKDVLTGEVKKKGKEFIFVDDVRDAVKKAKELADRKDIILVTGSVFTAAEARRLWFRPKFRLGIGANEDANGN